MNILATVNFLLIICAIISFCQMCKELFKWLYVCISSSTYKIDLESKTECLKEWSKTLSNKEIFLNEHALHVGTIHVKALYVLLGDCAKKNDQKTFDLIIKQAKKYNISENILSSMESFGIFIQDLENKKYIASFNKKTGEIEFIKNEN